MRNRFIQNEILVLLSDKRVHTAQEIADELEVSTKTVYRHVRDLSNSFQIVTGFSNSCRGIQLLQGGIGSEVFSSWEIDFLISIFPTDRNESKAKNLLKKLYDLKQSNCFG